MINYNEEFINISSEDQRNVWTNEIETARLGVSGRRELPSGSKVRPERRLFNQNDGLEKLIYILLSWSVRKTRERTTERSCYLLVMQPTSANIS